MTPVSNQTRKLTRQNLRKTAADRMTVLQNHRKRNRDTRFTRNIPHLPDLYDDLGYSGRGLVRVSILQSECSLKAPGCPGRHCAHKRAFHRLRLEDGDARTGALHGTARSACHRFSEPENHTVLRCLRSDFVQSGRILPARILP